MGSGIGKLVLHIGTHKTGSSAIQDSLVRGDHQLEAEGTLYPRAGRIPSSGGHLNICWEWASDQRFKPERGTRSDLRAEVLRQRWQTVVVSAETFTARGERNVRLAERLVEEIAPQQVVIVGYVRPQWSYMESHYTQRVKQGHTSTSFDEYVQHHLTDDRFDYPRLFAPWREAFGERLVVRPYSRDVIDDFWRLAGIGIPPPLDGGINVRPGAKAIEMLRSMHAAIKPPKESRSRLFAWARKWLQENLEDDVPFRALTDELAATIDERFRDANREFASTYWSQADPPIFKLPELPSLSTWTLADATREERQAMGSLLLNARLRLKRLQRE